MGLAQFAKKAFNAFNSLSRKEQLSGGNELAHMAQRRLAHQEEMQGSVLKTDMATMLSINNTRNLGDMGDVHKVTEYLHGKPLNTASALGEEAANSRALLQAQHPWLKDPENIYKPLPEGSSQEAIKNHIRDFVESRELKYGKDHKIERDTVPAPKPKAQDLGL